MKFPRFYNPFRRIRELEAEQADLRATLMLYTEAWNVECSLSAKYRRDIRSLKQENGQLMADLYSAQESYRSLGSNWLTLYTDIVEKLDASEQANEAFMDEREDLKAVIVAFDQANDAFMAERDFLKEQIALREELGIELVAAGLETEDAASAAEVAATQNMQALIHAVGDVEHLNEVCAAQDKQLRQQAAETLEVVAYVKSAEKALEAAGIRIEDQQTAAGVVPVVTVDQEAFLAAMRLGLIGSRTAAMVTEIA